MKPYEQGWENLSELERLTIWLEHNKKELKGNLREYKTLMSNFIISCKDPKLEDYLNFQSDIRHYPLRHQKVLQEGFFAAYNTTYSLLGIEQAASCPEWSPELN